MQHFVADAVNNAVDRLQQEHECSVLIKMHCLSPVGCMLFELSSLHLL